VFARGGHPPNSKLRRQIVPEKPVEAGAGCSLVKHKSGLKQYGMSWAQRLKRVFCVEGAAIGLRNVKSVVAKRRSSQALKSQLLLKKY